MGTTFWVRRFFLVLGGAFAIIAVAQFLKGHELAAAVEQGFLWAPITAAIFIGARIYQSRRGLHCAICRDTPEMQGHDHPLG
ncbi:MAG: hypothetical protein K1Y36_18580 [Blastocatellia bacterium]|nr:hypothetical protein [Blastocatellia bacterium]